MDERDTLAAALELLQAIGDAMPPFPENGADLEKFHCECFRRLSTVTASAWVYSKQAPMDHTAKSMHLEADYLRAMWKHPLAYAPETARTEPAGTVS